MYEKLSFMGQIKKGMMGYYLKIKKNQELGGIESGGWIKY